MIHRVLTVLIALSALTVLTPGHAETPTQEGQQSVTVVAYNSVGDKLYKLADAIAQPVIDIKELNCLAKNIFFEAGGEPVEGKVAVGLVTLNRMEDPRFPKTVCGVVDQRVTRMIETQGVREIRTAWGTTKTEPITIRNRLTICQFSWRCMFVKNPKSQDERWLESQQIARELLATNVTYSDLRVKYADALYFHATSIRPTWARQKEHVARIGGHHFYGERNNR
jgi:spore germination cell wall hydrolase CwlJ-like protein